MDLDIQVAELLAGQSLVHLKYQIKLIDIKIAQHLTKLIVFITHFNASKVLNVPNKVARLLCPDMGVASEDAEGVVT